MRKFLNIAVIFVLLGPSVWGQGQELFDEAATAYNEGRYEEAAALYEKIIDGGEHSAAVYFNLGNTYYKLNRVAPSIYYYEKALLLDPDDPEIKENLGFAQNMTLDAVEKLPETDINKAYEQVTGVLTYDQWAFLAVLFMVLFVLGMCLYMVFRFPREKRLSFTAGLISLGLMVISLVLAYVQYRPYTSEQPAIIFAEETAVRTEPNTRSEQAFLLHEGTKVNVLDRLNDWQRIELENGQSGWLLAEDLKVLKDF